MIGIQYILNLYNISQTELSEDLGIAKQNISRWCKGEREISKKYLEVFSKKFNIPIEYFQKELIEIDKLKIQKLKIQNDIDKTTKDNINTDILSEIQRLNFEIEEQELLQKIKKTIEYTLKKHDKYDSSRYVNAEKLLNDYKIFVDRIINNQKKEKENE